MSDKKRIIIYHSCLLAITSLAVAASAEPIFGADNVCNKTILVRRDKTIEVPVKYQLEYSGICHGFLPCTKTKTETRLDSKVKTTLEQMDVAVCCPGYAESPSRECVPICIKPCNHGTCIAPGQCKCQPEPTETSPGFVGSSCNRFTCLSSDRWGSNCERECNCPQNSYCSASTGKCICRTGWRGANCTDECDSMMNCDEVELPPIIDPDSNIISDKIESLAPRALLRDYETTNEDSTTLGGYNFSALYLGMNFAFLTLVCCLVFALWRKNKDRINDIYYTSSSGSSGSGSSPYYSSASQGLNSVQNRPMPSLPDASIYGKNLNFDSATRYILLKGDSPLAEAQLNEIKINPKLEAHLIASKQESRQNLYSDVEQGVGDKSLSGIQERNVLHVNTLRTAEDSHYQVPKSPAIQTQVPLENSLSSSSSRQMAANLEQQNYGAYSNDADNIYEEIKPRSP